MKAEIIRQIELAQVLLFLADVQEKTCQCISNKEYGDAITCWFSTYKNNPAAELTRELVLNKYFFHIKPLRAILSLDTIVNDESNDLHEWAVAVKQFKEISDFDAFFDSQTNYYSWILKNVNSCDFDSWIGFIESYFRQKPDNFKLIICPIAGNYGFNLERDGKMTSYTVRCMPYYDEGGNPTWQYVFFAKGIAHEYAHCFVNSVVESNNKKLKMHDAFFDKHTNIPSSYNVNYAVINEYFVRAFQIRFMEQNKSLFPDFDVGEEYKRQRTSFIFIDNFVDLLKDFEKSGLSFSAFYIDRIDSILKNIETL